MVEATIKGWTEPQIPIQTFWHRIGRPGPIKTLGPKRAARPVQHLAHRTNSSIPYPFAQPPRVLGRLIAYGDLRGYTCLASYLCDSPRLINCMGHRLLTEDMFALLHRGHRDGRMQVVRGADHHRVEVMLFFKQFTEVAIGGAASVVAGAFLVAIVAVYDFLAGITPCHSTGHLHGTS
jgi:hypothetical protein